MSMTQYLRIYKLLMRYERAKHEYNTARAEALLLELRLLGVEKPALLRPFHYGFALGGIYTEIMPDGTVITSYGQWCAERRRRGSTGFRWFAQWRRDWKPNEILPDSTPWDKRLFFTAEAEVNYILYAVCDSRFLPTPMGNNACRMVAEALAACGFRGFPYRFPTVTGGAFELPHGVTEWRRGLISHPRWKTMCNFATPTMLYGFDSFCDGAVDACQHGQRGTLKEALPHLLTEFHTLPPQDEWRIVALRAIAAYALCLERYRIRPQEISINF